MADQAVRLSGAMKRRAADERDVYVPDVDRRDKFGAMAATVQIFKENGEKIRGFQNELEDRERKARKEMEDAVAAVKDAEVARAAEMVRDSEEAADRAAYMRLICRDYR